MRIRSWICLAGAALLGFAPVAHAWARFSEDAAEGPGASQVEPGAMDAEIPGRPSAHDHTVPFLVVTDRALVPEFHRLAHAHTHAGLNAAVRTLQAIRVGYPSGRDDAERIRMFLKDAHAFWGTNWVLLGGDDPLIPMRRAFVHVRGYDTLLPTDQYYACLGGTWNADGDSLWGEFPNPSRGEPGDSVDVVPVLNVGRAPVTTREEARVFVEKTLQTIKDSRPGTPISALLAASVQDLSGSDIDYALFTEGLIGVLAAIPDIHVARLYQNWQDWPGSFPESRQSLLDSLNRGYDLAVLAGPGGLGLMTAGPHPQEDVLATDCLALTNGRRLSQVFVFSAFTNEPGYPNIGGALMRAPRGGAVAVIGVTSLQLIGVGDTFMNEFFRQAYVEGASTVGEALKRTVLKLFPKPLSDDFRLTAQGNLLLGDPALPMPGLEPAVAVKAPPAAVSASDAFLGSSHLWLSSPVPNPATMATRVDWEVPAATDGRWRIDVLDIAGRQIRAFESGAAGADRASVVWDLRDLGGARVPAGLYFVRLAAGSRSIVRRLVVAP